MWYHKIIDQAVSLLQQNSIIAFPTDTLYALGANPNSEQAIAKIFALKGRAHNQALPVLLPKIEDLWHWIDHNNLSDYGKAKLFDLAENFWPGPLTIVLKKAMQVSNLLTANQDSIALRVPNHPLALELLKAFNSGIIGTSANKSGGLNLTEGKQIINTFGKELFVIDGGKCPIGVNSTIISIIGDHIKILRQGSIPLKELSYYLKTPFES